MNKIIFKISAVMPFIYLLFISVFFLLVGAYERDLPSYGNPDPKNYPILFFIENILLLLVPISFVIWLVIVFKSINKNWKSIQKDFLTGIFGFLLLILLVKFDPMGILNWLAD